MGGRGEKRGEKRGGGGSGGGATIVFSMGQIPTASVSLVLHIYVHVHHTDIPSLISRTVSVDVKHHVYTDFG